MCEIEGCWLLVEEVDNEEDDPNVSGQCDNVQENQITIELQTKFRRQTTLIKIVLFTKETCGNKDAYHLPRKIPAATDIFRTSIPAKSNDAIWDPCVDS